MTVFFFLNSQVCCLKDIHLEHLHHFESGKWAGQFRCRKLQWYGDEKPLSAFGSSNSLEQSGEEAPGFWNAQLARSIIRWSVSNALLLSVYCNWVLCCRVILTAIYQRKYISSSIVRMIDDRKYYENSYLSWHRTDALSACGLLIDQWPVHR